MSTLVYIAGPFTAPTPEGIAANIARATEMALHVAESGCMPVCPHSNTSDPRFLGLQDAAFWYAGTLALMRVCDAIALTDDWQSSDGACREVIEAHSRMYTSGQIDYWRDGELLPPRLLPVEAARAALAAREVTP